MSVCPWCRAEVRESGAPCRNCGKLAEQHPSAIRSPQGARSVPQVVPDLDLGRGPAMDFDDDAGSGPALEIAATPARAPQARPLGPPPPSRRPQTPVDTRGSGGGAMFDDDDMDPGGGAGVSLELDLPQAPSKAPRRADSLAPSGPPPASRGAHGPNLSHFKAGPTGGSVRPPPVAAPPMEAIEARLLGNFGDPPKSWWQTPLYAWKVRARLVELRQALGLRRQDAARAEKQAQAALVALGQRARATAETAPAYGRTLEGLKSAEALLRSRDGALMADMDVHTKKMALLDQRAQKLEAELAAAQAVERKVQGELAELQAHVQRAEANMRKLDLELRSGGATRDPRRGGA